MRYRTVSIAPASWRARIGLILGAAVGLGLAAAFVVLSLGLALLLLPVVAILFGVAWWRRRRIEAAFREAAGRDRHRDRVIEIDYRVLDEPDPPRRGQSGQAGPMYLP